MMDNEALAEAFTAIAAFMDRIGNPGDAHPVLRALVAEEVKSVCAAVDQLESQDGISTPRAIL